MGGGGRGVGNESNTRTTTGRLDTGGQQWRHEGEDGGDMRAMNTREPLRFFSDAGAHVCVSVSTAAVATAEAAAALAAATAAAAAALVLLEDRGRER